MNYEKRSVNGWLLFLFVCLWVSYLFNENNPVDLVHSALVIMSSMWLVQSQFKKKE